MIGIAKQYRTLERVKESGFCAKDWLRYLSLKIYTRRNLGHRSKNLIGLSRENLGAIVTVPY